MITSETYVKCNNCGENDFDVIFEKGKAQIHRIVKCRNCGLMYANPQTDNVSDVETNYSKSSDDTTADSILDNFTPQNHQYLKKQYLQLKDYSKILDFLEKSERGKFVEIGSYAGIFLNEAKKRGWDVLGIEPLEIPALYSEKKFGIKVIRKYFDQVDMEKESVKVISTCHVIEHVPDPAAFVKKAFDLLQPGGYLIMETPTYDSFTFSILRRRERSVRCDGHLFFYTKKTLTDLAVRCGFKVVKHEKVGRTLTLDRLFYNLGVITGGKKFFSSVSRMLKLDRFVIRLNMGDMQRIYCEKI